MKYKLKITILLLIFGFLMAVWAAGIIFSPEKRIARAETAALYPGKVSDIQGIELKSSSQTIVLSKTGTSWSLIENSISLPVLNSRVDSFIKSLSDLRRHRLVSNTKKAWDSLGLGENNTKSIILKSTGNNLAEFLIGGYDTTGANIFYRKPGSDKSYSTDTAIVNFVEGSRNSWLDLRLLEGSVDDTNIQSMSITANISLDGPDKPKVRMQYTVIREGNKWKINSKEVNSVLANNVARSISNLEAQEIAPKAPVDAFSTILASVDISLSGGVKKRIEIGKYEATTQRFYIRAQGGKYSYEITGYSLHNILKPESNYTP